MTLSLSIELPEASLESALKGVLNTAEGLVAPAQAAMAGRYHEIVQANFGQTGLDRPATWPLLSPHYAKKVGRPYATLFISGLLFDSVKLDPQAGTVSMANADCPYALAHHFGNADNNLPSRRVFPMLEDGRPTTFTAAEVTQAAAAAVKRELS